MAGNGVRTSILQKRINFEPLTFAIATALFGVIAVPVVAIYLRSWRVALYYVALLILIGIVGAFVLEGSDESTKAVLTFMFAIPINAIYAYAIVSHLKGEALEKNRLQNQYYSEAKATSDSILIETRILRALADHGSMTIGHICASTGCTAVEAENELRTLVEQGVVKRLLSRDNPPIFHLI
jgi:hypothetical protein